jgi:hypothetical protein
MNLDEKLNALPQTEPQPADRSVQPAAPLTQVSIKRRKPGGAASLALPRKARKPEEGAVPAVGAASVVEVARAASPAPRRSRKSGLVFGPVPNGSAEPDSDDTEEMSEPVASPVNEIAEPAPAPVEPPKALASAPVEPEPELEIEIEIDDEPTLPFVAAQPAAEQQPEPAPQPAPEPVKVSNGSAAAAAPAEPPAAPPVTAVVAPEVPTQAAAQVAPQVSAQVAEPAPAAVATPAPTPTEPEVATPAPTIPESTPAHVPLPSALSRSEAIARAVRMAALSSARSNGSNGNGSTTAAAPRMAPPQPPRPAETPRSSDLFGYWSRMKNGRRFPARGDFDANEIAENWPNSMLLTCEGQGSGISFSKILRYGGHRSRPGEEFSFTSMITEWILSIGGEVARVGRPVQDNEVFVTPDGNHSYRIVALPLGDEQSRVDHVLCHLTRA